MNDITILRDLLKEDVLARVRQSPEDGNSIGLEEEGDQGYTLKVTGTPNDAIALKTDKFPPPKHVFNNTKHECKRADYVIITSGKMNGWIIYIEMKRSKGSPCDIRRQLHGAKCVVAYCCAIVQEFWCEREFLKGYHERFVTVGYISMDKQRTRKQRGPVHDNPKDMLKRSAPDGTIPFHRLIYGH